MSDTPQESLPRVTEPISAPSTLDHLIADYNARSKLGETAQCALLLKDALGYFVRYYAAVCVSACRELDCLPGEVAQEWTGTPAVDRAVPALHGCLERLRGREERIGRKLVSVFFEQDGGARSFTQHLFESDSNPEFRLVTFCSLSREYIQKVDRESLAQAAHLLDAWVSASFAFFLECEQRLETGAYFGQLEQVVQFEQYTLRTGLTMRVHESRGAGSLPALAPAPPALAPLVEPLAPEAAAVAEGGAAPVEASAVAEATAPADQAAPPEPKPARPLPPEQLEAAQGLQRLVKASGSHPVVRKEDVAEPAPEAPEPGQSRLDIRLEPLGFVASKRGRIGYGGYLWINSTDGDSIQGVVSATGGEVELTPTFFEGVTNRVVYWVHSEDVAAGKEYIQVSAAGEERLYSFWKLAPPSRFENFGRRHQVGLLMLPPVLGTAYSCWVLVNGERVVDGQLRAVLRDSFNTFFDAGAPLSLQQAGIGELDVSIRPRVETGLLVYLVVAWLVPVIVTKIYARLPRRDQSGLLFFYLLACCLPLLTYLGLWNTGVTQTPITRHPELAMMDYRRSLLVFALLNVLTTAYEIVSLGGFLHRFLNELGRFALSVLLAALAALLILYQVYGTSWFQ